ncbi:hypothetical protein PPERSA_02378 [Pseudocohnilembus persalinus]|uniref:Uncharacterized protein n=1 Tax=Pseudocohnilembus persalinus TaxID=266149 RepID=A0A0V0QUJ4_PSEPJ|nr:hypothetical protein PPERSA_02378 [Pseudocohnilembus persalinus]|eukprot:KRX05846.1 hypothetical protein PPERSA_02378 [Pseudocohnilembus persalinus]
MRENMIKQPNGELDDYNTNFITQQPNNIEPNKQQLNDQDFSDQIQKKEQNQVDQKSRLMIWDLKYDNKIQDEIKDQNETKKFLQQENLNEKQKKVSLVQQGLKQSQGYKSVFRFEEAFSQNASFISKLEFKNRGIRSCTNNEQKKMKLYKVNCNQQEEKDKSIQSQQNTVNSFVEFLQNTRSPPKYLEILLKKNRPFSTRNKKCVSNHQNNNQAKNLINNKNNQTEKFPQEQQNQNKLQKFQKYNSNIIDYKKKQEFQNIQPEFIDNSTSYLLQQQNYRSDYLNDSDYNSQQSQKQTFNKKKLTQIKDDQQNNKQELESDTQSDLIMKIKDISKTSNFNQKQFINNNYKNAQFKSPQISSKNANNRLKKITFQRENNVKQKFDLNNGNDNSSKFDQNSQDLTDLQISIKDIKYQNEYSNIKNQKSSEYGENLSNEYQQFSNQQQFTKDIMSKDQYNDSQQLKDKKKIKKILQQNQNQNGIQSSNNIQKVEQNLQINNQNVLINTINETQEEINKTGNQSILEDKNIINIYNTNEQESFQRDSIIQNQEKEVDEKTQDLLINNNNLTRKSNSNLDKSKSGIDSKSIYNSNIYCKEQMSVNLVNVSSNVENQNIDSQQDYYSKSQYHHGQKFIQLNENQIKNYEGFQLGNSLTSSNLESLRKLKKKRAISQQKSMVLGKKNEQYFREIEGQINLVKDKEIWKQNMLDFYNIKNQKSQDNIQGINTAVVQRQQIQQKVVKNQKENKINLQENEYNQYDNINSNDNNNKNNIINNPWSRTLYGGVKKQKNRNFGCLEQLLEMKETGKFQNKYEVQGKMKNIQNIMELSEKIEKMEKQKLKSEKTVIAQKYPQIDPLVIKQKIQMLEEFVKFFQLKQKNHQLEEQRDKNQTLNLTGFNNNSSTFQFFNNSKKKQQNQQLQQEKQQQEEEEKEMENKSELNYFVQKQLNKQIDNLSEIQDYQDQQYEINENDNEFNLAENELQFIRIPYEYRQPFIEILKKYGGKCRVQEKDQVKKDQYDQNQQKLLKNLEQELENVILEDRIFWTEDYVNSFKEIEKLLKLKENLEEKCRYSVERQEYLLELVKTGKNQTQNKSKIIQKQKQILN